MLASFGAAYLKGDPLAAGFLDGDFRDPQSLRAIMAQRTSQRISVELAALLTTQQNPLGQSVARERHMQQLCAAQGAGVVVTGQQVGLFLGPLYTVYKAATAVAAARTLSAQTGQPIVPLFWLQTEDHDYEEIRSCTIPSPNKGEPPLVLSLPPSDPAEQRMSVAYRQLGPEVDALLSELESWLHPLPHSADCVSLLRRHYAIGRSLAQAFSGLLCELFADEGLLCLDPRQPGQDTLPKLAAPLYRNILTSHETLGSALLARQRALSDRGFACQIPVRPQSSLLFFHPDGERSPRHRLQQHQQTGPDGHASLLQWAIPQDGRRYSQADLLARMDSDPLSFGTSALVRPLVQDTILPTVAYVGGPAELSYFAQVTPLYHALGIVQPVIMPRARFRLIDESTRTALAKLALRACDVEAPKDDIMLRLAQGKPADVPSPQAVEERLLAQLLSPLSEIDSLDPALQDAVHTARRVMEKTAKKISLRYAQRLHEKDTVNSERIDRLQAAIFPSSTPQERLFSLPFYLAKYGLFGWKQRLFESLAARSVFSADQAVRDIFL